MRRNWLVWSLVLPLLTVGPARADDTRLVPAVGTSLTYRLVSTTKSAKTISRFGEILSYAVTRSDGTVAEGTIKPLALIYGCAANKKQPACDKARKIAGAEQNERDLVVPVPAELAARLVEQSHFRFRTFVAEERAMTLPKPTDKADGIEFIPGVVVNNGMKCPDTALRDFLPFGGRPGVTLQCELSLEQKREGQDPKAAALPIEVVYLGKSRLSLRTGDVEVQNLGYNAAVPPDKALEYWSDVAFSERLGAVVRTRVRYAPEGAAGPVTDTTSELIAVSP